MNNELLNKMIDHIECNLTSNIDYKILGKIVGENEFILQRIFVFLTGITISEYIRKRRLSKAYEEIISSNNLIIDIAYKYGYNSLIAFDRSFKKEYGITPRDCRRQKNKNILFPKMNFKKIDKTNSIDYEIIEIDEMYIYCFCVQATKLDDLHYKIRELYRIVKKDNTYEIMNEKGMYAISTEEKDNLTYYLGSSKPFDNTVKKTIPKGKYIKFNLKSREQKKIIKESKNIHNTYIPSTNYITDKNFDIEYYVHDTCYLLIPLK